MAYFSFTKNIVEEKPIKVFNEGKMKRDFTYIDDIVEGTIRVMDRVAEPNPSFDAANPDPGSSQAPYRVYNIGNNRPIELMTYIETLEAALGIKAQKNMLPMQAGDVEATYANIDDLTTLTGFAPVTPLAQGIERFVQWYREYYKV